MEYLTSKEILIFNQQIQLTYGTRQLIRDAAALDYIVRSAKQEVFGKLLYSSIAQLGAFYLIKITKKHIFNDGNKRTAFLATNKFLNKNDFRFMVSKQYEIAALIVSVATTEGEPDGLWTAVERRLAQALQPY